MPITKQEMALVLSVAGIGLIMFTGFGGVTQALLDGNVKFGQTHFDQAWQFLIMFGGAAMLYFGFRAGQSKSPAGAQT